MGHKLMQIPEAALLLERVHGFHDDFYSESSVWSTTATDSGTTAISDAAGGVMAIAASDGTAADNDETYYHQAGETFKFAANKPIQFESYVQFTEANTDDANVYVGFLDGWAANALQDNGAGPKTTASGVGFYKVDGGTNWNVFYSDSTTQTSVELTAANSLDGTAQTAGGSSYQKLGIQVLEVGSRLKCLFFIDDVLVYTIDDKTFANATEMEVGFGVKNGGANAETLNVDYVYAYQAR